MLVSIGGQGDGKTRRMIGEAYLNSGIVLVFSEASKKYVKEQSKELNMPVRVFSLVDINAGKHIGTNPREKQTKFYIDELDIFLYHLLHVNVEGVSLTDDRLEYLGNSENELFKVKTELVEKEDELRNELNTFQTKGLTGLAYRIQKFFKKDNGDGGTK